MHADRVVLGFKRWAVESFVPPLCKLGMYSMTLETPPQTFYPSIVDFFPVFSKTILPDSKFCQRSTMLVTFYNP